MKRLITVLASVGVVVALWLLPAQAQTDLNRSTLKGLTGVQVVVENMAPALEAVGLRRDTIQTRTELRLRRAGVRVLSEKESAAAPGQPYLYVNFNGMFGDRGGTLAVAISISLVQDVRLERNPKVRLPATTWREGSVLIGGVQKTRDVLSVLEDYVDKFANDFLAQNPKKGD